MSPSLLISTSEFPPGPGGIGAHAYNVASELARLGWEVVVVTPQDYASDEEVQEFNRALAFEVVRLRRRRFSGSIGPAGAAVSAAVRRRAPQALLASGMRPAWLGAILARRFGLSVLAVGHGSEFLSPRAHERELTRRAFNAASAVVCVSRFTWASMSELGVRPRAGRVIHNGADSARFFPFGPDEVEYHRRRLGLSGRPLLLTVGNVTDRKGQEVVIRALPHLRPEFPEVLYLMAGLPTKQEPLQALAAELGVERHVKFLGRVRDSDLPSVMNLCDVFLMTSRRTAGGDVEGFGIAVVEAALCAKPAVVSTASGLVETIVPGETGIAVEEGDSVETARAIATLLRDAGLRDRMGKAARARALATQTWGSVVREYDSVLRDLVGA